MLVVFFSSEFFEMVRQRLHLEITIMSSLPYLCSSGVASTGAKLCVTQISWDPVGFPIRCRGFRSRSSGLHVSSLAMVAPPMLGLVMSATHFVYYNMLYYDKQGWS
jgi:hypothetical protein